FVRADSIDIALSVYALAEVDDLGRVFRQVHRVLKTGAPLVFSLPHPAGSLLGDDGLVVRRSYFDRSLVEPGADDTTHTDHHRTIAELVTFLSRANFRVDAILEPEPV